MEGLSQEQINCLAIEQGLMAARDTYEDSQSHDDQARRSEAAEISGRMSLVAATEKIIVTEDWSADDSDLFRSTILGSPE